MFSLYVLFILDALNFSLFLPVFEPYFISLGGSQFGLGITTSVHALITLFWIPVSGSLSDSKGRKILLIYCSTAAIIGHVIAGFTSSLSLLFIGRLISAFGSPVNVLLKTVVTDRIKSDTERNNIFVKLGIITPIIFIFGFLISSFMSEINNGMSLSLYLIATNYFFVTVLAYTLPDNNAQRKSKKPRATLLHSVLREIKTAATNFKDINWSKYGDIFLIKMIFDFASNGTMSVMRMTLIRDYKLEGRSMGYYMVAICVFLVLTNVGMMTMKKYYSNQNYYTNMLYGCSILLLSNLAKAFSYSFSMFALFDFIATMATAFLNTIFVELITSKTSESDKGTVISSFENLNTLAMMTAPPIIGIVADVYGARNAVCVSVLPLFISIAITLRKS